MHPFRVRFPRALVIPALAALALGAAAQALAQTVPFSGSIMRMNPPAAPGGACAPLLTIVNTNAPPLYASTGLSNRGSFLLDSVHCLNPVTAVATGDFTFDFGGGDTLHGDYHSISSAGPATGVFDFVGTYTVLGGTGVYAGAGGSFVDLGRLDRRDPAVAYAVGVFNGQLMLVPEPASAALLLMGVAGVLAAARRRRG